MLLPPVVSTDKVSYDASDTACALTVICSGAVETMDYLLYEIVPANNPNTPYKWSHAWPANGKASAGASFPLKDKPAGSYLVRAHGFNFSGPNAGHGAVGVANFSKS